MGHELDRTQHECDRLHEANAKLRGQVQLLEERLRVAVDVGIASVEFLRDQLHAAKVEVANIRELERRRCGDLARHYGANGFLIHAIEAGLPHPFSCMVEMVKPAAETVCTGVIEGVNV